jgi:hypothetical protein
MIGVGCSLGCGTATACGTGEVLVSAGLGVFAGVGVLAGSAFFSPAAGEDFFFFAPVFFLADFPFAVADGVGRAEAFGRGVAPSSSSETEADGFFFFAAELPGFGVGVFLGFALASAEGVFPGFGVDFFFGDAVGDGEADCLCAFGFGVSSSVT